ncbi:MAG: ribonuclease HI family protein [Patescibacteria group bacterium]|jgi:ribonuclease HI
MTTAEIHLDIYTDGGARGNPGPSGIGAVIKREGKVIGSYGEFIGTATNNQAEYRAVLLGIQKAKQHDGTHLHFYLDSELVASQLRREYKVKDAELAKLFVQIWNLTHDFKRLEFSWIPREQNYEADAMVNQAIDRAL